MRLKEESISKRGQSKVIFLILPEQAGRPRRLAVRVRTLRLLGLMAVCAFLLASWTLIDYVDLKLERIQLRRELQTMSVERNALMDQTGYQSHQIRALSSEIDHLGSLVNQMARFDASIRQVTNLKAPGTSSLMTGGAANPINESASVPGSKPYDFGNLHLRVEDLLTDAKAVNSSLAELDAYFADRRGGLASTPSIWPVKGWVTSGFGMRSDPFTGKPSMHEGIDIATAHGTPIMAPGNGTVSFVGERGSYGMLLIIKHGQGVSTLYGHLSGTLVQPGQKVRRGQPVAMVGSSGRSTGPHLHYEVQVNGVPVDPSLYILD